MTLAVGGFEEAVQATADALVAPVDTAAQEREAVEEFITELTDLALDLGSRWPSGAPATEVQGLWTLLKRAREAYAVDDREGLELALVGMRTVLSRIRLQVHREQIDDPGEAMAFLDSWLRGWSAEDLARVVGAQPRVLSYWRSGTRPRKAALERLQLVAELVMELRTTMTARGIRLWFDNPVAQLGSRSPLQVLDEHEGDARSELLDFVRGGLR